MQFIAKVMVLHLYPYEMSAQILVTGEDAADFLQSQFSNDLRPFTQGQVTYGLWLDVKGKVVADSWVRCEGDERFRIYSELCSGQVITDKLNHHIIADDVELLVLPAAPALALIGVDKAEGGFSFHGRRSLQPSCEVIFENISERETFLNQGNFEIVSEEWVHAQRIEAGFPLVPAEIGPGELPGEGKMEMDAVCFAKGCFLGQEVVARMHNVGRSRLGLFVVEGEGEVPGAPAPLNNKDQKSVGELRSAYKQEKGWIGVALLKIRYVDKGLELVLDGNSLILISPLRESWNS